MSAANASELPHDTAFDTAQFESCFPAGIEHDYWTIARNAFIADAIREARRAGAWSGGLVMEVGCGSGIVTKALADDGFPIRGVDLGRPQPMPGAEGLVTLGVEAKDLPETERRAVELVLLPDVIEHLPDPAGFMAGLGSDFPNLQGVVVTVPARPEVFSNYDEYYGHFRRYTPELVAEHFDAAGFDTIKWSYAFRSLYVAARLMKLASMPRETMRHAPKFRGLHKVLAAAFRAENALASPFPALRGLSLIGIGKRRA
ncbi:MAG: class I SAM-dependent methyltransferase [Beijerinckiaceae bacterium]